MTGLSFVQPSTQTHQLHNPPPLVPIQTKVSHKHEAIHTLVKNRHSVQTIQQNYW